MQRILLCWSLVAALALVACEGEEPPDDGGERTADAGTDAAARGRDAGPMTDGGPGDEDASPLDDGGSSGDAGPPGDAGMVAANLSFFVTSRGTGAMGGDLGGLTGADARCQAFADAVGAGGRTFHAYLSASPIGGAASVNARDRIGDGPWFNARGEMVAASVAALHADGIPSTLILDETGAPVPSNEHDIMTGSREDGTAYATFPTNPDAPGPTCQNWTCNATDCYTYVGHSDWSEGSGTWSSSHETTCDEDGLRGTLGSGRLYCFAI